MTESKKKADLKNAWQEARQLVWHHRKRLGLGLVLMLVSRLAGLVLPASSKFLIDEVIGNARRDSLMPLRSRRIAATLVDAASSFALSQVLGVAAQRAIADMRKSIQAHVTRLPIRYFDSTQTGVLISRIMSDAEGIRNLVGTGLAQLTGSLVTAVIALGVLFYLNWQLTVINLLILGRLERSWRPRSRAFVHCSASGQDQRRGHRTSRRVSGGHSQSQGVHRRKARGASFAQGFTTVRT